MASQSSTTNPSLHTSNTQSITRDVSVSQLIPGAFPLGRQSTDSRGPSTHAQGVASAPLTTANSIYSTPLQPNPPANIPPRRSLRRTETMLQPAFVFDLPTFECPDPSTADELMVWSQINLSVCDGGSIPSERMQEFIDLIATIQTKENQRKEEQARASMAFQEAMKRQQAEEMDAWLELKQEERYQAERSLMWETTKKELDESIRKRNQQRVEASTIIRNFYAQYHEKWAILRNSSTPDNSIHPSQLPWPIISSKPVLILSDISSDDIYVFLHSCPGLSGQSLVCFIEYEYDRWKPENFSSHLEKVQEGCRSDVQQAASQIFNWIDQIKSYMDSHF